MTASQLCGTSLFPCLELLRSFLDISCLAFTFPATHEGGVGVIRKCVKALWLSVRSVLRAARRCSSKLQASHLRPHRCRPLGSLRSRGRRLQQAEGNGQQRGSLRRFGVQTPEE